MIQYIKELKDFGIFRSFSKDTNLNSFKQFNLFYGWNGSGKSTLSRLFNVLEKKVLPSEFSNSEIKIVLQDGSTITNHNLDEFPNKLCVFNQEFINENINWNESLKSLLLISEEKIDEHGRLQQLLQERNTLFKEENTLRLSLEKEKKEIDNFLSATAKKIKTRFQVIDTSDRYYFNYNKARLDEVISNVQTAPKFKILSEAEVAKITKSIKPNIKEVVNLVLEGISIENYQEARNRLINLTQMKIISYTIERLRENPEINKWVEDGIHLHKNQSSKKCEFCGKPLTDERIKELENHFNDAYKEYIEKLKTAHIWLLNRKINIELPSSSDFYDEFKEDYNQNVSDLVNLTNKINELIDSWTESIEKKIKEPFGDGSHINDLDEELLLSYNNILEKIRVMIQLHNNKTTNFKAETDEQKKMLEYHFMLKAVEEFKFFGRQVKIGKGLEKKKEIDNLIRSKDEEINHLERLLSNEVFGASVFNEQIHSFLGHKELSLRFDDRNKGYRIIRNNKLAKNLSEGEKTAVAFVYFIVKLKERGNLVRHSIIIVDDPISSFDSNNLFHAYSYLKNEFQEALQLFVLTHNFVFYKLLRDWLNYRGIKERSSFFTIETRQIHSERESYFKNTNSALLKYNSEYHYLFSRIYDFKEKSELNIDEAFLVSNLCRKLLESFLSFKFPKKRGSFNQLVNDAITDRTKREKIYKFINKYSHNQTIEFEDNTIDNLLAESPNIVLDVLEIIRELDVIHYTELENIINEVTTG